MSCVKAHIEPTRARHIAAPQFGRPATLHAQMHSPVPEATGRRRVSVITPRCASAGCAGRQMLRYRNLNIRDHAVSWMHRCPLRADIGAGIGDEHVAVGINGDAAGLVEHAAERERR